MANPNRLRAALRVLIEQLDADLEAGRCALRPPALLRIDDGDIDARHRHVDLHMKALGGHPVDALAGFTAPPEWIVVGVVAEGWSHPARQARVRIITLLSREGVEVSAVRLRRGGLQFVDEAGSGQLADTLKRVLGRPSPDPDATMGELLTVYWLDAIVEAGGRGTRARRLDWDEAAALHPVAQMHRGREALSPFVLPATAARRAARMDWDRLRQLMADAGNTTAAWMDAGMFARSLVATRPPLPVLHRQAARRLTREAMAKVDACLISWDLLHAAQVA
jgi:hypothetical protein